MWVVSYFWFELYVVLSSVGGNWARQGLNVPVRMLSFVTSYAHSYFNYATKDGPSRHFQLSGMQEIIFTVFWS